ncbi:hypothetical protein J6590_067736 [Homalodisca vitripennis]|nr:hypothetical protein J6590_067736 [Homalodisca vitripennis]
MYTNKNFCILTEEALTEQFRQSPKTPKIRLISDLGEKAWGHNRTVPTITENPENTANQRPRRESFRQSPKTPKIRLISDLGEKAWGRNRAVPTTTNKPRTYAPATRLQGNGNKEVEHDEPGPISFPGPYTTKRGT